VYSSEYTQIPKVSTPYSVHTLSRAMTSLRKRKKSWVIAPLSSHLTYLSVHYVVISECRKIIMGLKKSPMAKKFIRPVFLELLHEFHRIPIFMTSSGWWRHQASQQHRKCNSDNKGNTDIQDLCGNNVMTSPRMRRGLWIMASLFHLTPLTFFGH
jgi:hypothetical protein